MTHPLQRVAELSTRARVRKAIGPCAGVDPERHADLVTAAVLRVRLPDLAEDLHSRAAQLASRNGAGRLDREGSIA